jgi:hypothetical protein
MDFDKVVTYLECRISLHEELLLLYPEFGQDTKRWSNFGLRGAITLALNNMKKFYSDENDFNFETKKVLKFLDTRINNLQTLLTHELRTELDYQAKIYYDRYKD